MRTCFEMPLLACALSGALLLVACGGDETYVSRTGGAAGVGGAVGAGGEAGAGATQPDAGPAAALLDGIVVDGVAVALKPAFSPHTRRYSVIANDPADTLVVTATAAAELQLEVDGRNAKSGRPVELSAADPGSEIEIAVENADGERHVYTIVYLPYDFPDLNVRTHQSGASSDPIYLSPRGGGHRFVAKLNNHGVPLFYQSVPTDVGDFKKHPTGQYSYALQVAEGLWEHVVLDEKFREETRVTSVGLVDTDSHEFHILPNGNYIVLAYEPTIRDLTEWGRGSADWVVDAILQELSPEREVLFQWNSWDHMTYGETVYHKSEADYSHINSVFVDVDGNWILSSRGMAQVLKIDRETGEVLWRLGGASNEFTFTGDPFGGLCGQHTATRVANGNLLLFDNGQSCYPEVPERGELTRVVEYEIDEDAKTARLVMSYSRDGAYTVSQGSAQRLDNGDTFIGWGLGTSLLATEVDAQGNIVFELDGRLFGVAANSYRAFRFPD